MIEVVEVSRSFSATRRALSDVSFTVPGGSVTGLLGPNGAGKTTLFRIVAGLLRPDSGRAAICGHDPVLEPAKARAVAGFLTEEPGLPGRLSPLWHLAMHATLRGFPRREALQRSRRLLARLGAGDVLDRRHATLSKGTRAKVALARALVHDPAVMLLDEPTANLDIETSELIRGCILEMAGDGCAALLATHLPGEAEKLCDRFVILGGGRVIAAGTLDELRAMAGCAPRLEARLSGPAARALESARRLAVGSDVRARGEWLIFSAAQVTVDAGAQARPIPPASPTAQGLPTMMDLIAAAAPLEILELRRQAAPLEEVYRRLQEGAA